MGEPYEPFGTIPSNFHPSVLLAVLALLVRYAGAAIPVVSGHSFETMLVAFLLLLEHVLRFPILRGIPKFAEQCESFLMMTEGGDGASIQPGFA